MISVKYLIDECFFKAVLTVQNIMWLMWIIAEHWHQEQVVDLSGPLDANDGSERRSTLCILRRSKRRWTLWLGYRIRRKLLFRCYWGSTLLQALNCSSLASYLVNFFHKGVLGLSSNFWIISLQKSIFLNKICDLWMTSSLAHTSASRCSFSVVLNRLIAL